MDWHRQQVFEVLPEPTGCLTAPLTRRGPATQTAPVLAVGVDGRPADWFFAEEPGPLDATPGPGGRPQDEKTSSRRSSRPASSGERSVCPVDGDRISTT